MTSIQFLPKTSGKVRILWGVDPFDKSLESFNECLKSFDLLAKKVELQVQPIYFMRVDRYNWSGDYSGDWVNHYQPIAENALNQRFSAVQKNYIAPPVTTFEHNDTEEEFSDLHPIEAYVRKNGYDWVALARNAKSPGDTLFTGSFTEDMLNNIHVPLLVFEPNAKPCDWNSVFAPINFSEGIDDEVQHLIEFAQGIGAKLTLVHKVINPIEPFVQSGVLALGGGWISLPAFIEEQTKEIQNRVDKWKSQAKSKNIVLDAVIDSSPSTLSDLINGLTKDSSNSLVVVSSRSGRVRSWLGGSVGRQIVHTSPTTVLIQHIRE